jgi:hypothetical protein
VRRDFTAAPGEKMVGDITYIPTWQGWLYLATVIDCHTKAVIGWAAGDNYKTPLIEQAIEMAARDFPLAANAIFHSHRGSNYTSQRFAWTLKKHNLRQSAGRTGICYDNAMAESFFAALKNERVHRTQYPTREHARRDIVRYIEFWYNSKRRHSGLQYRTRGKSTASIWNSSLQRELTQNPLSGKLGADQRPSLGPRGASARPAQITSASAGKRSSEAPGQPTITAPGLLRNSRSSRRSSIRAAQDHKPRCCQPATTAAGEPQVSHLCAGLQRPAGRGGFAPDGQCALSPLFD